MQLPTPLLGLVLRPLLGLVWLLQLGGCASVAPANPGSETDSAYAVLTQGAIAQASAADDEIIYVIYQGWHTSLLLPAATVARHSRYLAADASEQRFVRIGWGDGDYFTGKSKSTATATKALFFSGHSALQVLTYSQAPFAHIAADTRVPIALGAKDMQQLIAYIDASLWLDAAALPVQLPAFEENTGVFYRSQHNYGLFRNCNSWTGRALQEAGLPVRSRLALTAQSIFNQARRLSQRQQAEGRWVLQ